MSQSPPGIQLKNLTEFSTETMFGAAITRLLTRAQLPGVGFDHVKIQRGATLEPHIHEASESFLYVLAGSALVRLDGQDYKVGPGDTIYIPAGVSHGFSAPTEDVVLLSVQVPPIYPDESAPDIKFG